MGGFKGGVEEGEGSEGEEVGVVGYVEANGGDEVGGRVKQLIVQEEGGGF